MTKEEIRENNNLIKEFMELEISPKQVIFDSRIYYETPFLPATYAACEDYFAFHNEWNWLMPVVVKLFNKGWVTVFYGNYCIVKDKDIFTKKKEANLPFFESYSKSPETLIEAVYECIVKYIKWSNQNK